MQHATGLLDHHPAVVGEPAALAVDQRDPEFSLEAGDGPADVRLDRVEGTSGGGERSVVCNRYQSAELTQIHLKKR